MTQPQVTRGSPANARPSSSNMRLAGWHNAFGGAALSLAMAACSTVPGTGPRTNEIERGAAVSSGQVVAPYVLVNLDLEKAGTVTNSVASRLIQGPITLPPGRRLGLVGPGDLLKIAIWMPDTTGMSLTTDKSGIETEARVDASGSISVPYIGRLSAAGHMPAQIEQDIAARLAKQSPGAQVALLVAEDVTNDVIVQGAVSKPGRYPIVPNSSGLLDILAVAGGPQTPNYQALVRITRADTAVTRTLTHLLDDTGPGLDLAPGDRILVQPRRSYFYAFGDVMRPGEQPYDADEISLARILARLDGLADNRADPAAVFVYRRQSADLTQRIAPVAIGQDATRVIYRLNLRDPGGFFVSEAFPVLPDDLIYVSDAPITEATKVFQVVTGLSSIGAIPRNFGAPY